MPSELFPIFLRFKGLAFAVTTKSVLAITLSQITPLALAEINWRYYAVFIACDAAGYAVCCGAIGGMDLRPGLGAIAVPTLMIAGRDDPSTPPAMAEEICTHVAQAEHAEAPELRAFPRRHQLLKPSALRRRGSRADMIQR